MIVTLSKETYRAGNGASGDREGREQTNNAGSVWGKESQVHDFTKLIPLPAHKALGNILLDFKDNLVLGILSKQS